MTVKGTGEERHGIGAGGDGLRVLFAEVDAVEVDVVWMDVPLSLPPAVGYSICMFYSGGTFLGPVGGFNDREGDIATTVRPVAVMTTVAATSPAVKRTVA